MSYDKRKALRRSLLEKEFTDSYSLNPKLPRQGRDFGPQASQLLSTVTSKREDSAQRHETLELARVRTAKLDPLKLLDDAIKNAGRDHDEEEYEALMLRYKRGDHIFSDRAKDEMADAELESKMYSAAANIFSESKTMSDFESMRAGDVQLPPVSPRHALSLSRSSKYINTMKDRSALDQRLRRCKAVVAELQDEISTKERRIAEVTVAIEESSREGDFDWHLDMNSKVRSLTAQLEVDKEDLAHAKLELDKTESAVLERFPDMSAQMSLGILDQQCKISVKAGGDPFNEADLTCTNVAGEEVSLVYGWLLGKFSGKGEVSTMLFGQFTLKRAPPRKGWVHIGKNVVMDDPLYHVRTERGQPTGMPHEFLNQTKNDKIRIKNVKCAVMTTDPSSGEKTIKNVLGVVVKGCTHNEVNGRYLEEGLKNNCYIFKNVNGWTISRQSLQEIPEMDIYADGCYVPATLQSGGETVSDRMKSKTWNATSELLRLKDDGTSNLADGSAAFKRRFAELARVGNRMVVADHQDDLLHTENLKAEGRLQSDEEMLLRIAMAAKQMKAIESLKTSENELHSDEASENSENESDSPQCVDRANGDDDMSQQSLLSSQADEVSTLVDEGHEDLSESTHDRVLEHSLQYESKATLKASTKAKKFGRSGKKTVIKSTECDDNFADTRQSVSELSSSYRVNDQTCTGRPVDSYNNLDFKVLSTKNIQAQVGSQGFVRMSKKSSYRQTEEADLSINVIRTIEEREECLHQLKVEAAAVQDRYVTSHERSTIDQDEEALATIVRLLDSLRHCTIRTVEAIGAWARRAVMMQESDKKSKHYLEAVDASRSRRKYSVLLAVKGRQLYPQSSAMQYTNNRRFRRGLEIAQSAVEVCYVGVFDSKQEACDAFVEAASKVPLEQRYAPYEGHAPKMFIGLRQCGNHYMVRSVGVPPELPCEQCGSSKASNFKKFIPQATERLFPQFLYHGENYLDKMWIDTQFLGTVTLLNRYFGRFDCFMNPLQLTKSKLNAIMDNIILFASELKQDKNGLAGYIDIKPLSNLRGKYERFRVASEDAIKRGERMKEVTIDGIAYRMPGKLPNLDSDLFQPQPVKFMSTNIQYLDQVEALELQKRLQDTTNANIFMDLRKFSFSESQSSRLSDVTGDHEDFRHVLNADSSFDCDGPSGSNDIQDKLQKALSQISMNDDDFSSRPSAVLDGIENGCNEISIHRLQRTMIILGQSQSLSQKYFNAQRVPSHDDMSTSSPRVHFQSNHDEVKDIGRVMSKSAGGSRHRRERNMEEEVKTIVQYTYFGAQLKTVQMRPRVAHRVENMWVRSDVGEWFGTQTKGRHMKRFDRIERIVQDGKRKRADREDISQLITKAIQVDFVSGGMEHVKYLKQLIERSAKHKGSVLDLDVLKAEKWIKDRKEFIKAVKFVQRTFRGFSARDLAWCLREQRRIDRLKMVIRDQETARIARSFVPDMLEKVVRSVGSVLAARQFQIAHIVGGTPMILSVYMQPRGIRRNQHLCDGCQMKKQRVIYDPSKRKRWDDTSPCFVLDRYPCTCVMVQGPERWLLEAYDPISSRKFCRSFTASEIHQHVFRTYYESKKLADKVYHRHMLYGKSFGNMKPLFLPNLLPMERNELHESPGKLILDASKEYAILGSIPRHFSDEILYGMKHLRLTPALADVYSKHLLKNVRHPIKVNNLDKLCGDYLPDDLPDVLSWQPINDVLYAKHQFEHIKLIAPVMEKYMFVTRVDWEESRDMLLDHRFGRLEHASMQYEDVRSRLVIDECKLKRATELVSDVMEFSKKGLAKIEAEERNEREDWNQAWEGVEDASRWKQLNNARKFRVKLNATLKSFSSEVEKFQEVLDFHANLVKVELEKRKLVNSDRSKIEELNLFIAQTQDCVYSIRRIALEVLKVMTSAMTIPSSVSIPAQRKMKFPPTVLPYIRDPAKRAQSDYRSGWDLIYRKFVVLKPLHAVGIHKAQNSAGVTAKARCIVTVYKDTLFDNYVLNLRPSDEDMASAEENTVHTDLHLQKTDFAKLNAHCKDNDIIVSEEYVKSVLFAKSFNWPENKLIDRDTEECGVFSLSKKKEAVTFGPYHPSQIGYVEKFDNSSVASSNDVISRRSSRPSSRQKEHTVCLKEKLKTSSDVLVSDNRESTKPTVSMLPLPIDSSNIEGNQKPDAADGADVVNVGDGASSRGTVSVRVRTVDYNRNSCRTVPQGGYFSRQQAKRDETEAIASKIVNYLRLNPHSLRPCLALLPFHRRQQHLGTVFIDSLWFRDMMRKRGTSWLYSEFRKDKTAIVCQREFAATMRDSYGEITIRLRTPFRGKGFGAFESEVMIPFESVLSSLMTKPLLLTAFLCETITNSYSHDCVKHILENIDLTLPGEDGRWWRGVLTKEKTPEITFMKNEEQKFRGPVFCANKFVSSTYCNVRVYMSSTFDLKILFSPPNDGLFWFQALKDGSEVTAILSNDAILSFLLKKQQFAATKADAEKIKKMYHLMYLHSLIHFLLEHIELKEKVELRKYFYEDEDGVSKPFVDKYAKSKQRCNGAEELDSDCESEASGSPSLYGYEVGDSQSVTPVDTQRDELDADNLIANDSVVANEDSIVLRNNMNWRQKLRVSLWKCVKKFNYWVEEHKVNVSPISSKTMAELYSSLREYDCPPHWVLTEKDASRGEPNDQSMIVYDGFWPTVDPRVVVRKPVLVDADYLALNSASVYSKSIVDDQFSSQSFNNFRKPAPEIVFQGDAYYRVLVGTDAYKSVVKVDVHETEATDPVAEKEVHRKEQEQMQQEDKASALSAEIEVESMLLRHEASIRASAPSIPPEYLQYLVVVRENNVNLKAKLRRLQHKLLPLIDSVWDKAALNASKLAVDHLAVSFDEKKSLTFHIDSVAIEKKCQKFSQFYQINRKSDSWLSIFNEEDASNSLEAGSSSLIESVDEIAIKNEAITKDFSGWLERILKELNATKNATHPPSIAFQQFGVSTKAYPGLPAPREASAVDGFTSKDGVSNVMSYQPAPFSPNTFRTNVSWKRTRPLRNWELGSLASTDASYLRRARKGIKPHFLRYKRHAFMVSAPNVGPADASSVNVYSPATGESIVLGLMSNMKLPLLRGLSSSVSACNHNDLDAHEAMGRIKSSDSSDDESSRGIAEFDFETGIIRILKIEAHNLRSVNMVGKNSPFVCLRYGDRLHATTSSQKNGGSDVEWAIDPDADCQMSNSDSSGHLNFEVSSEDLQLLPLEVEVNSANKVSGHTSIGKGKVQLGVFLDSRRWEEKVAVIPLRDNKQSACGEVHILFEFIERPVPTPPHQQPHLVLARTVAERVVWRSLVNGITVAAIKSAEKKIDEAYEELEKEISRNCQPWFRHTQQFIFVDKAGNLQYSSALMKRKERPKLPKNPKLTEVSVPSSAVETRNEFQDTHERKILFKKFSPELFKRKVSLMKLSPHPLNVPRQRARETVVHGMFVPADEDEMPISFSARTCREWESQCNGFLHCSDLLPPHKHFSFPAIIYCRPRDSMHEEGGEPKVNLKLNKFIFEYIMQTGWRKGDAYLRHKKALRHERTHRGIFNDFDPSPSIPGDAVLLFRHGIEDVERLESWCKQRHFERLEMIERRRLREEHEHNMRVTKFLAWRGDIYCIAAKFGPLFEKYYYRDYKPIKYIPVDGAFNSGVETTESGRYRTNSFVGVIETERDFFAYCNELEWRHLRFLLLRYSELLQSHPEEMKHCVRMMDQDYAFATTERENIFESYDRLHFLSGEEFLKFQWNTFDNPRNLQYQTGHVLYALYLGHCEHCCVIPGTCPIPGCNAIRQMAHGHDHDYGLQRNSDKNCFVSMRGRGCHPLEIAVKKYLFELTSFEKQVVYPSLTSPIKEQICSEISSESTEFTKKAKLNESRKWRRQVNLAKQFRYLHRHIVKPCFRGFLDAEEVLEAKGGHDDREEVDMPHSEKAQLSSCLPSSGLLGALESVHSYNDDSISTGLGAQPAGGLLATASLTITTDTLKQMMGISMENIHCFDVGSYDPAPPLDVLQRKGFPLHGKNCMTPELFAWILKHIRMQRELPLHDKPESGGGGDSDVASAFDYYVSKLNDESLLSSGKQQLRFDRQQCHGVAYAMNKDLIVVQVLQGVIPRSVLRQSVSSGRPPAAVRFLSDKDMSQLHEGLTLSVHHVKSDVTICLGVEGRRLDALMDALNVSSRHYPSLGEAVLTRASRIIDVHLADGVCTDVTLSLKQKSTIKRDDLVSKSIPVSSFRADSRCCGTINRQKRRLRAACLLASGNFKGDFM